MALCRVYLLTYRRNHLLPRALNSLLNQTFTDWICELHNDDPSDPFPRELVEKIADPRIVIVDHVENLGPTRTFNLVYQPKSEVFISLLEDDNWWEPHFLATMINAMEQFPNVQVAWANMRLWQEESDGSWTDIGKNIWNSCQTDGVQLFDWGQQQQIMGAIHSNGAMILRSQFASNFVIPDDTPFASVELVRERAFHFPILFVPQVCANFAITQSTSRSKNRSVWSRIQILMTASFFKHVPVEVETIRQIWLEAGSTTAKSTSSLFFAALICPDCRQLLKYARLKDWIFFIASCLKRPKIALENLQATNSYPDVWNFLDRQTAIRVQEMKKQVYSD
ncbi:glycosyl transferase family protein [Anabaenopsis circularis NIES-21]|uniref:Glycosyl transferase family protein n=2 Tax=Nostocales TaxID=1161 RepID=A0A1Z4GMF9_9CYAN|nr:glycosyltransferase [Nostoc cycadae]BAY18536.1 glycosyl transferase family protein [Anabaenopsis circularis NIES-21]GBE90413.1 hypothetical protein NCWK1_0129 [Nostoc cycadae WK-1]